METRDWLFSACREGDRAEPQRISPNISQETLAEMVGTTRSRVSHFMNKFRKLGLITYNGHIEVNNSLLSAVLHEKPVLKEDDWIRSTIKFSECEQF